MAKVWELIWAYLPTSHVMERLYSTNNDISLNCFSAHRCSTGGFLLLRYSDSVVGDPWNPCFSCPHLCLIICFICDLFVARNDSWISEKTSSRTEQIYSRTSMARTPLGPWKSVRAMGSSSQWRLIMAPGREANIAYSGKSIDLLHNNCMLSVLIRIASKRRF